MPTSKCKGIAPISGTPENIRRAYEKMAYDAERAHDMALAQLYFNHAEHWMKKRIC